MKIEIISENNKEIKVRVELPARLFASDSIECIYKRDVGKFISSVTQKSEIKEIIGPEKISNRNNGQVTQEYSVMLVVKEDLPQKKPTKKQEPATPPKIEATKPKTTRRRIKKT